MVNRFLQNGFRLAFSDPQLLGRFWKVELKANEGEHGIPAQKSIAVLLLHQRGPALLRSTRRTQLRGQRHRQTTPVANQPEYATVSAELLLELVNLADGLPARTRSRVRSRSASGDSASQELPSGGWANSSPGEHAAKYAQAARNQQTAGRVFATTDIAVEVMACVLRIPGRVSSSAACVANEKKGKRKLRKELSSGGSGARS